MTRGSNKSGLFKKVPKAPEFNGTDVSYPSWSQNFLLKARYYNLVEPFTSDLGISIANVSFDLTPWIEKGYSVFPLATFHTP